MKIINLGILAHVDAGKTTLTESLLYTSGAIAELGSVDEGTTRTDTMNLERQREFPIVKDTTPNMMNPRLYTTSYNKPQGQQFDDTAVLSFIKLQYT